MKIAHSYLFFASLGISILSACSRDYESDSNWGYNPYSTKSFPSRPAAAPARRDVGAPQHRALLFGANCEDSYLKKRKNIFVDAFSAQASSLKNDKWALDVYFGGPVQRCTIESTDARCSGNYPSGGCCPEGVSTQWQDTGRLLSTLGTDWDGLPYASREHLLDGLDKAMQMPEDSELLVVIDTHGSPRSLQARHGICVSESQGIMPIDEKDFMDRLKLIKQLKIKTLVMDVSCFSGDTIDVVSPHACALASQVASRYTWGSSFSRELNSFLDEANHVTGGHDLNAVDFYKYAIGQEKDSKHFNFYQMGGFKSGNQVRELVAQQSVDEVDATEAGAWEQRYDRDFPVSSGATDLIKSTFATFGQEAGSTGEFLNLEKKLSFFSDHIPFLRSLVPLQVATGLYPASPMSVAQQAQKAQEWSDEMAKDKVEVVINLKKAVGDKEWSSFVPSGVDNLRHYSASIDRDAVSLHILSGAQNFTRGLPKHTLDAIASANSAQNNLDSFSNVEILAWAVADSLFPRLDSQTKVNLAGRIEPALSRAYQSTLGNRHSLALSGMQFETISQAILKGSADQNASDSLRSTVIKGSPWLLLQMEQQEHEAKVENRSEVFQSCANFVLHPAQAWAK